MAPKCIFVALNLLVIFALVSGCEKCPTPSPSPSPSPPSTNTSSVRVTGLSDSSCPRDALKLGVCSSFLNGLMNYSIGLPPTTHCCSFFEGLADFEVAVCLCTALKANIMGYNIDIPISFTNLVNVCSKDVPNGFLCS
ncbi:14 kDa proline-rich protein DC2.15-like [Abrus precatorius]|uniref:14 kDa proline-rich protein DC2.15-like n=1 Tax=Abrus precatorius TaxID=3816 RepID=A0A8B8M7E0_ABRPR|nr:14 kDa proline-rich protein DC2.15-like [Abrus precatorius]